jgi:hypothetical protein
MAFQAGSGYGGAIREWFEEEKCMVGMDRVVWQLIPDAVSFLRIRPGMARHCCYQGRQQECMQQFMHYAHMSQLLQNPLPEGAASATVTVQCSQ